jgi:crotonobetainyl-CoA:carnitine CoA-transferase CaiB-like acyl-CoA transferase
VDNVNDDLPFVGLKVVDLSQGVAGPHGGMMMALNGADVIKIEPPTGDWGRALGRQYGQYAAYNIAFNRGKRSLGLDLKHPAGLAIARRLMEGADVVVENNRPGVMARFGLDYPTLKQTNPAVIYTSVTGFGQTGPRSKAPATDSILQSFSGLMSVNRDRDGMPQRLGVLVIDVVTGLYAFQAIATALYARAVRGAGGRHISVSLMESIGAVQAGQMIEYHLESDGEKRTSVPVGTFRTADGHLTINARRDRHFQALTQILGLPELASDAKFSTMSARAAHAAELMPIITARIATWETDALMAQLQAHDILHGPINDYAGYFSDTHVRATEAIRWIEHATVGRIPIPRIPGLPLPEPDSPLAHSPAIGEHSRTILRDLGYGEREIAQLVKDKAVAVFEASA